MDQRRQILQQDEARGLVLERTGEESMFGAEKGETVQRGALDVASATDLGSQFYNAPPK